jgi:hypothetical protein
MYTIQILYNVINNMYTNTNPVENYVHKYKSYIYLCTLIQILHLTMPTNINIVINHVPKCKSYTILELKHKFLFFS